MKQLTFLMTFIVIVMVSCTNNPSENKNEKSSNDLIRDTTEQNQALVELSPEIEALLSNFSDEQDLPLVIDSSFFKHNAEKRDRNKLHTTEVKMLASKLNQHELSMDALWNIDNFHWLDSIIQSAAYEEYLQNLDIGMMKESFAIAVNKLNLDEQTVLLVWSLTYSTYEACPFAAGTLIMGTLMYQKEITNCVILGEISSAGDPPVGVDRKIYSSIDENMKGRTDFSEVLLDENENFEIVETETKESYEFSIEDGKAKYKK